MILLISINAITAANAPPAFSFAQLPPIAAAKRICRLLITAQPIFSITLPTVTIAEISAPAIAISLPRLIISPAAGITAITVISTLPSFWRKSKLNPFFFLGSSFFTGCSAGSVAVSASFSSANAISLSPAFTVPSDTCISRSSAPSHTSTGVIRLIFFDFNNSTSTSATRSPIFTLSPTAT